MPLLARGLSALVFRTGLVDSNQKEQGFGELPGPARQGDCVSRGPFGESRQERTFPCDSADCYLKHMLPERDSRQFKAPAGQVVPPWSRVAKLSTQVPR